MALGGCKRDAEKSSSMMKNESMTKMMKTNIENDTTGTMRGLHCRLLELPIHLINDILARLPLNSIFSCGCVCRTFLKLLKDPYFAKIHYEKAATTAASLVVQERLGPAQLVSMYTLDLDETLSTSSCFTDHHHLDHDDRLHHQLTNQKVELCFLSGEVSLIGSCNGLLCLYHTSSQNRLYCICNPVLGEYIILPPTSPSTQVYSYLNHSRFGFCPRTKQYKVIRFMCLITFDASLAWTSRTVAEVHTLGTESWRGIGDVPCPMTWGSFDSFLNGAFHWITNCRRTSQLICSFDLETEQFRPVPPPPHFDPDYLKKISWINVGSLGGCLCVCYVFEDVQFSVWMMKDYGSKESWTKQFSIDIKFYCALKVEDLHQPIKFLHNGDLWLICNSNCLVSYSPKNRTFRDFSNLGVLTPEAIAHIPSFVSLEDIVRGKNLEVRKVKWESTLLVQYLAQSVVRRGYLWLN